MIGTFCDGRLPEEGMGAAAVAAVLEDVSHSVRGARSLDFSTVASDPRVLASQAGAIFANVRAGQDDITRAIEADLKAILLSVLRLPDGACVLTGSGTESLALALFATRQARGPNAAVVIPGNAHPALYRAAGLLGMSVQPVAVTGHRADAASIADAVTSDTEALAISAPAWGLGLEDDIQGCAALASRARLHCHVDACIGGFLYPFLEGGWPDAPGITSITVDLHKFGYGPYCLSALCLTDASDVEAIRYETSSWDGFPYVSEQVAGDRPFAPIAGTWAVMRALGQAGYRALARLLDYRADALRRAFRDTPIVLSSRSRAGIIGLYPQDGDVTALSARLLREGISSIPCLRPGFVRLRVDPLEGEADFARRLDACARAASRTSAA